MIFTWKDIQKTTSGVWAQETPAPKSKGAENVVDDSRSIQPGDLFIAIRGSICDGHDHLAAAAKAGADAICIERRQAAKAPKNIPCLLVNDTLEAFHQLAREHRNRFKHLKLIGITGSSGKTSARCMLTAILEQHAPNQVLSTQGNTNNHFGVPRNLLEIKDHHQYAVLEIGSNHPGEIAQLTRLAQPNVGLITNIGSAHLEYFGSLLGVAMEKSSLFAGLKGKNTVAVMPDECPHDDILRSIAKKHKIITFGESENADVKFVYQRLPMHSTSTTTNEYHVTLSCADNPKSPIKFAWAIGGKHQARNAAAACAVAKALEVGNENIKCGLSKTQLPKMRMEIIERNGIHWVNDAYNANPDSMRGAINWFRELTEDFPNTQTWLVLADMLELGECEAREHEELLQWTLERFPPESILTTGPRMTQAAQKLELQTFKNINEIKNFLDTKNVKKNDWILLKGSRGMKLEKIIPA